jgi:hypothetical protein
MRQWERQNDSIRTALAEVEKTERAIEREEYKIAIVESMNKRLPKILLDAVESGEITQWRKYPNRFFVPGVESARMIWQEKDKTLYYNNLTGVTGEERKRFAEVYKRLADELNPLKS